MRVQLSECIAGMRHCSRTGSSSASGGEMSEHRQDALIKRYQEIHFDYSTEFKNTSVGFAWKHCDVLYKLWSGMLQSSPSDI